MPAKNPSQMPESARGESGWRSACQSLKSPTTETARAFGAQTAKRVPASPFSEPGCAPSFS
jgi:hypothetical protein